MGVQPPSPEARAAAAADAFDFLEELAGQAGGYVAELEEAARDEDRLRTRFAVTALCCITKNALLVAGDILAPVT
jgi:hypothetical protein